MENKLVCRILFEIIYIYNHSFIYTLALEQLASSALPTVSLDKPVVKVNQTLPVAESMVVETATEQVQAEEPITDTKLTVNNPCVFCWKEEKRLACIPCGHLVACVNCSQTLRTCPVCRRSIEAFVRIYI
jgi:hypothetical protein